MYPILGGRTDKRNQITTLITYVWKTILYFSFYFKTKTLVPDYFHMSDTCSDMLRDWKWTNWSYSVITMNGMLWFFVIQIGCVSAANVCFVSSCSFTYMCW